MTKFYTCNVVILLILYGCGENAKTEPTSGGEKAILNSSVMTASHLHSGSAIEEGVSTVPKGPEMNAIIQSFESPLRLSNNAGPDGQFRVPPPEFNSMDVEDIEVPLQRRQKDVPPEMPGDVRPSDLKYSRIRTVSSLPPIPEEDKTLSDDPNAVTVRRFAQPAPNPSEVYLDWPIRTRDRKSQSQTSMIQQLQTQGKDSSIFVDSADETQESSQTFTPTGHRRGGLGSSFD